MKKIALAVLPGTLLAVACGQEPSMSGFDQSFAAVVAAGTNAHMVSNNVPTEMRPGETRIVQIQVENSGTVLWDNNDYQLRTPTVGGLSWSPYRITSPVAPAASMTVNVAVTAPSTPGRYNFDARMYVGRRVGGGFFGETLSVPIDVTTSSGPEFDALLISNTVPAELLPGERVVVSFVMRNTGWHTWQPLEIDLRSKSTGVRTTRSRPLVPIAQGQQVTFPATMSAPAIEGLYIYSARLSYFDGTRTIDFGPSIDIAIVVSAPDTMITSANITDPDASFDFSSPRAGSTFECALDGAPFAPCTSPFSATGLAAGAHNFAVRAVLNGFSDQSPAMYGWTIVPPAPVCLSSCPLNNSGMRNGSFELGDYECWTIADAGLDPWGTWGIATNGQVVGAGAVLDFGGCQTISQGSPGLPWSFTASEGSHLAYLGVNGPMMHRLYQDVTVPVCATTLSWEMAYTNHAGSFDDAGQYVAIELVDPSNDSLLSSLFRSTQGVDPQSIGLTTFSGDVSAYAGQAVRVNVVAEVENFFLDARFDNFQFDCN